MEKEISWGMPYTGKCSFVMGSGDRLVSLLARGTDQETATYGIDQANPTT